MNSSPLIAFAALIIMKPAPHAPVEGPPDELVSEVVKSLEASAVERIPLERYATFGLDALAESDKCLTHQATIPTITVACGATTISAPWPPKSSDEVAALLSNAIRLVDPEHVVRTDRARVVARALSRAVDDPFTAYLPPELVAAV